MSRGVQSINGGMAVAYEYPFSVCRTCRRCVSLPRNESGGVCRRDEIRRRFTRFQNKVPLVPSPRNHDFRRNIGRGRGRRRRSGGVVIIALVVHSQSFTNVLLPNRRHNVGVGGVSHGTAGREVLVADVDVVAGVLQAYRE